VKKDERLNTKAAEANIGLNEKMNEDVSPAYLYNTRQLLRLTSPTKGTYQLLLVDMPLLC
jgi:hypothetical protein